MLCRDSVVYHMLWLPFRLLPHSFHTQAPHEVSSVIIFADSTLDLADFVHFLHPSGNTSRLPNTTSLLIPNLNNYNPRVRHLDLRGATISVEPLFTFAATKSLTSINWDRAPTVHVSIAQPSTDFSGSVCLWCNPLCYSSSAPIHSI